MSLSSRVKQIAQDTVKAYVATQNSLQQNTVSSSNSVQVGSIQSYVNGQYSVILNDGTTVLVNPGGLRPLGPGSGVLISNGAIIG